MRRIIYILFIFNIMFIIIDAKAACSNEIQYELNVASSSVTMKYFIDTLVIDSENKFHPEIPVDEIEVHETSEYSLADKITLKIENVSDKIYIVLRCLEEDINQVYHYNDLDNGSFTYDIPDFDIIRHFELTIYSNENECLDEELRKIEVATPKYNKYYGYGICDNNDAYYCKKYITTDIELEQDIFNSYNHDDKKNTIENNDNNINEKTDYKLILIIVVALLIIGLIIISIYFIIQKKKKNELMRNIGGN